jgi:hypothetical protein
MSSKEWPETRTGKFYSTITKNFIKIVLSKKIFNYFPVGGILSNNAAENPYWWQANHV